MKSIIYFSLFLLLSSFTGFSDVLPPKKQAIYLRMPGEIYLKKTESPVNKGFALVNEMQPETVIFFPYFSPDVNKKNFQKLKDSGVQYIFSYIDPHTTQGGAEAFKRSHWIEWNENTSHSKLKFPAEQACSRDQRGNMQFEYGNRWLTCINQPDVRTIAAAMVKQKKQFGFNGVEIDNPFFHCYCPLCRDKFDTWLRKLYTDNELAKIFKVDSARKIPMVYNGNDENLKKIYKGHVCRFFDHSMGEFYRFLKEEANKTGGSDSFQLFPNIAGHKWGYKYYKMGGNFVFYQDALFTTLGEPGVVPGLRKGPKKYMFNNIFDLKYGEGCTLMQPSVQKHYKGKYFNKNIGMLGLFEAFAMHCVYAIYPKLENNNIKKAPNIWVKNIMPGLRFIQKERKTWKSMIPYAETAILYSANDYEFDLPEHYYQTVEYCLFLQRVNIPFIVFHMSLLKDVINSRPVKLIILPYLRMVSKSEAKVLQDFVKKGGTVLFAGDCGTYTSAGVKRNISIFNELLPEGEYIKKNTGKGNTGLISHRISFKRPQNDAKLKKYICELAAINPLCDKSKQYLMFNQGRTADNAQVWTHILNYGIDINSSSDKDSLVPQKNLKVTIPIPPDKKPVTKVSYIEPGKVEQILAYEFKNGKIITVIPEINVYGLIKVE